MYKVTKLNRRSHIEKNTFEQKVQQTVNYQIQHHLRHKIILFNTWPQVRTLCTTSSCIKLKHIAINAIPNIRYIEQKMKEVPDLSLGTMSPKPIVLKEMKQK